MIEVRLLIFIKFFPKEMHIGNVFRIINHPCLQSASDSLIIIISIVVNISPRNVDYSIAMRSRVLPRKTRRFVVYDDLAMIHFLQILLWFGFSVFLFFWEPLRANKPQCTLRHVRECQRLVCFSLYIICYIRFFVE